MAHYEEYRGHQIAVDTRKVGNGYLWSYQIGGGDSRDSRDRPLRNERLALAEGIREAKAEIDRLEARSTRKP
jgi:hypothetical protein